MLPPIAKQKRYPALSLTVIHAQERHPPKDRPRIDWKPHHGSAGHDPVEDAIQMLDWYAMRWKVEMV